MKQLYLSVLALVGMVTYGQEVTWQRNIKSNTQDFLSQLTTTIDGQILLSGSTIQTNLFILLMRGRLSTQGKRPIMNFRQPTILQQKSVSATLSKCRNWRSSILKSRITERQRILVQTAPTRTRYCTTYRQRPTKKPLSKA